MQSPSVSIVVPLFEDEEHVGAAIESCLAQTIADIEVIVIDDASTDGTVQVVERYVAADSRVRLIRQEVNQSAFQARKLGIEAARAPYILFLDGDDELAPTVAEKTLAVARGQSVDVVAFGCQVIKPDGSTGGDYEQSMQPRYRKLLGEDILQTLFPVGQTAQGQLWRYLFDRTLLANAYKMIDSDLVLPRANDIPIAFLAIMQAKKYVAIHEKLYRYYYRRGASGHGITTLDEYLFTAGAIDSIEAIGTAVTAEGARRADSTSLFATYESVRRSIIGRVLDYVNGIVDPDLQTEALNELITRVGGARLVLSAADFAKSSLALLASAVDKPTLTDRDPHHILLRASNLGTGGAQGVVVAQAKHLAEAGFRVTIGIDAEPDTHFQLPDGVEVVRFGDRTFGQRVSSFLEFCREQAVDVVIDHYIFYNERWPFYVLAAAADGIPTIGWLHNFALRPIVDGTTRLTFLETYLPTLAATVVLSETDATYWRFRGLTDVLYLPNPPSPVLEHLAPRTDPRPAPDGVLEIVWWGRLQQATKQVRDLIDVASELDRLEIDYKLTIIGPDGPDLKAKELVKLAQERGVRGEVALLGALHGDALADALARAHVFVSTSVIEGYPLVFTEAQALGLPLVAYNMPWLAVLEGNEGITSVKPGDRRAIAQALAVFANEPAVYQEASLASLAAASAALSHDFATMYVDLVRGALDGYMTTDGQDDHVRILLTMHAQYYERLLRRQNRAVARAHEETESVRHDLKNSRKRIDRLEHELDEAKVAQHKLAAFTKNLPIGRDGTVESLETMTPSVARTGWRGVLQKFLPTSMYQTSFYARNQHRISAAMLAQLNENQADLAHQLSQIEALLNKRKG